MVEQCIICLADLDGQKSDPDLPSHCQDAERDRREASPRTGRHSSEDELIARLQPCQHQLHNICLKPWLERANSCPICRHRFNSVHLLSTIAGSVLSSYSVEDRVQAPELDPSLVLEGLEDYIESDPCRLCGHDGDEADLLICDGCETCWHTYCVGLERVPLGNWFCPSCSDQQPIGLDLAVDATSHRRRRQRHGSLNVAGRRRHHDNSSPWARVRQVVWDRLNIDLDFPSDEEESRALYREAQRRQRAPSTGGAQFRDLRPWQRRLEEPENQAGSGSTFGDTRSTLMNTRLQRRIAETPDAETPEESRAWSALERVQQQEAPGSSSRKRRSRATSPTEDRPEEPAERKFKRPRTRRAQDITTPLDGAGHTLRAAPDPNPRMTNSTSPAQDASDSARAGGPSFLQSLLREAETSLALEATTSRMATTVLSNSDERLSPCTLPCRGSSSPATSLAASTSRGGSPSPSHSRPTTRPGSPLPLTSKVEPVFPAPTCSASGADSRGGRRSDSNSVSPSRPDMSTSAKTDISRMVQAALRPLYRGRGLSKHDYTVINRDVSRKLYDQVGDVSSLDDKAKRQWEEVAAMEVGKAVRALKAAS